MFIQNINPVIISIGVFQIRYYGLVFAFGFISSYFFLKYLVKLKKIKLNEDDISDFLIYIILGSVIGARLFHVFVYEPTYYLENLLQIFMVWEGGLSIHGGIIGAMVAGYYFSKKKKISFWRLADISVIPLSFALIFGRIANFTNSEFIGKITNLPWAVKFSRVDPDNFRHPVQIYEAIKNAIIFNILWFLKRKKYEEGYFFWLFIFLYSSIRFFLEFFKEWSSYYFGLALVQIICLFLAIISAIMLLKLRKKPK